LPPSRWDGGYFTAVGTTVPCREIGGDCYEYQTLVSGEAAFAVADVSGKGAPAALLTAVIQGALAAQSLLPGGPADAMRRTNAVLAHRALEAKFATMVYAVLAPDGRLTYCNAGHNPPFLVSRRGVSRLEVGGTILGLFEGAEYTQETVTLAPGDLVVLFSDGVSEALSAEGEEFGDARIQAVLEPLAGALPDHVNAALLSAVGEFTRGADPHDDMTVLVARYTG
jgi:sigma-B regulation protein RsbU (phosphoserine phosphatase)